MNCQTKYRYSRQLEELLHPRTSLATRATKIGIATILALSAQYDTPDTLEKIKAQSLMRWHLINDVYSSKFGECGTSNNQLQGVYRINLETLEMINCKTNEVYLRGKLNP